MNQNLFCTNIGSYTVLHKSQRHYMFLFIFIIFLNSILSFTILCPDVINMLDFFDMEYHDIVS